ncbi:hypothetical protein [Labrys sp. 22185]|uniref:hypothetical protein n=1 Tax=Labrys sp. 22185 TaxID=3453888 RepID=UPI003F83AD25
MTNQYRYLALYNFAEDLKNVISIDFLYRFISYGESNPTIVSIQTQEGKYGKWRRGSFSRLGLLEAKYGPLAKQKKIVFDKPVSGNFLNSSIHISYDIEENNYLIVREMHKWGLKDIIYHIESLSDVLTPSYGFSIQQSGPAAFIHAGGVSDSEDDPATFRRINDLGRSLRQTKEHLVKLHDLYPLNVLNDAHLKCDIEGIALGDWINEGNRGDLIRIKQNVYTWTVPDDIRLGVRDTLFRAGALIASV